MTGSSRFGAVGAVAWAAGMLTTACLSGETVDLGTNDHDAGLPGPDSSTPALLDSGVDAPADASGDDADGSDGPVDAETEAPPQGDPLCIPNPSFEAESDGEGSGPLVTDPPEWQVCTSSAANAQTCVLPPTDGSSYLGLSIGLAPFLPDPASVDATLCAPLEPGLTYSLSVDLALDAPESDASPSGEPPALQLRASNTACDPQADLLWRFSGATNTCGWKSLCAIFVPRQAYNHIILIPEATSSTGFVFSQTDLLVDHLRSGGSCPTL
jgi:hypothetical protein